MAPSWRKLGEFSFRTAVNKGSFWQVLALHRERPGSIPGQAQRLHPEGDSGQRRGLPARGPLCNRAQNRGAALQLGYEGSRYWPPETERAGFTRTVGEGEELLATVSRAALPAASDLQPSPAH